MGDEAEGQKEDLGGARVQLTHVGLGIHLELDPMALEHVTGANRRIAVEGNAPSIAQALTVDVLALGSGRRVTEDGQLISARIAAYAMRLVRLHAVEIAQLAIKAQAETAAPEDSPTEPNGDD